MISPIELATLPKIKNRKLADYARQYVDIYTNYMAQVSQLGIAFSGEDERPIAASKREELQMRGVHLRNGDKSLVLNHISPACEACQTGVGSATYFISLKCHRSCFFCFNPNQEGHDLFSNNRRDVVAELKGLQQQRKKLKHLALTGGEPLLFKAETIDFFKYANQNFPEAYKRLYTCGDHINRQLLSELQSAGLEEIRFSIRLHDLEKEQRGIFERIALAKEYIPAVMVEMPVLPGNLERMQEILLELDRIQIHSINLLEFCFPFHNAEEFQRRGYQLKNPPYRVLYDYWYAGGLPVAKSELDCLDLLSFCLEKGVTIGVHYCSLENKHTGQLYQQNSQRAIPSTMTFSPSDYFLKSAKVFGKDVEKVRNAFRRQGFQNFSMNERYGFIEFPLSAIPALKQLSIEIGISYAVLEKRNGEAFIRELALYLTTAQEFDAGADL